MSDESLEPPVPANAAELLVHLGRQVADQKPEYYKQIARTWCRDHELSIRLLMGMLSSAVKSDTPRETFEANLISVPKVFSLIKDDKPRYLGRITLSAVGQPTADTQREAMSALLRMLRRILK